MSSGHLLLFQFSSAFKARFTFIAAPVFCHLRSLFIILATLMGKSDFLFFSVNLKNGSTN